MPAGAALFLAPGDSAGDNYENRLHASVGQQP